jgi:hypothetical protein
MHLSSLVPTVIRDLWGFKSMGVCSSNEKKPRQLAVANAVDALAQIVLTAAVAYGFHRLAGGFSFDAVKAHRLYSGGFAIAAGILSPTTCLVTIASLHIKEAGVAAFRLYHNVALRSLKSYAWTLGAFLSGWAFLCSSRSLSTRWKSNEKSPSERYLLEPLAAAVACRLVKTKTLLT